METPHPLRILWSGRWWLLAAMVVAAVAAYQLSSLMPERYKAEALAQVLPRSQAAGLALSTDELLQVTNFYSELARTSPVERRAERTADAPRGTFRDAIDVEARPDLLVLAFSASADDATTAERRANAYARAFAGFVADQQSEERQETLRAPQERVTELQEQLSALPAGDPQAGLLTAELQALQTRLADEALAPSDSVRVIQPALAPRDPDAPKPLRNAILAAIAALVLAGAALLARTVLGDRYGSIEEAALDLRLPVLGEVPKDELDAVPAVEAFRKLRTRVTHALPPSDRHAVLITSPEEATGKSHVVTGLARSLGSDGASVVAIDADLRRPVLHDRLGVPRTPGLADTLDSRDRLSLADVMHPVPLPPAARDRGGELVAVPAGRPLPDSAEALSGPRMGQLVDTLLERFDIVVLDSPPVLALADAAVVSRQAGGVLLVVDLKRSHRRAMRRAVQALRSLDAPLLGLVHNRAKLQDGSYGYYAAEPVERERSRLAT